MRQQNKCNLKQVIILGVLVSFSGCQKETVLPPPPIPVVTVTPVTKTDAARELRLSGTLSAERSLNLSFGVLGTVEQVLVKEGEAVKRGQVLARIAPNSYQDALGIAQAKADQAQDAFRRLEPMYRNKTLPEVKMVEISTGRQQALLSLSMAKKNLADTLLRSTVDGLVARRNIEPGSNATPGLPAITIIQTKTMLATAPIPEMQVANINKGHLAKVTIPALNKTFTGTVREIGLIADPLTRTYEVKVELPNPEGTLRVGMIADVRLGTGKGKSSLTVPPSALRVDEQGAPCVFVVTSDKKIQRRRVEIEGFIGESTAISQGLAANELVVTSGTSMLADNIEVRLAGQKAQEQ